MILKTEWLKLKNYRAFWLLLAVTAISYPGIIGNAIDARIRNSSNRKQKPESLVMLEFEPFSLDNI